MASKRIDQYKVRNGTRIAYFADYVQATKWLREEFPEKAGRGFVVMETYDHWQFGRVATLVFAV